MAQLGKGNTLPDVAWKVLMQQQVLSTARGTRVVVPNGFPEYLLYVRSCKMAINKMDLVPAPQELREW